MGLTKRRREILHELVKGVTDKEIAKKLDICEGTVRQTLHAMYMKYGVRNRLQLAMMYREIEK